MNAKRTPDVSQRKQWIDMLSIKREPCGLMRQKSRVNNRRWLVGKVGKRSKGRMLLP